MARANTKIGDVFSVKIDESNKKYFQYIISDLTQLNSDVIRVFKKIYSIDNNPELSQIVKGEIAFYAHCITKLGIKMGYWEKAGNIPDVGDTSNILFRNTNDAGSKPGEQIKVSDKWYIWKVNDNNFTRVGKLEGENRKAEIGIVISPDSIVHRMQTGEYDFVYPGYE
jgi:glycosidase